MSEGYHRYVCEGCGNETLCAIAEVTVAGTSSAITFALRPVCHNSATHPEPQPMVMQDPPAPARPTGDVLTGCPEGCESGNHLPSCPNYRQAEEPAPASG